MKYKKIVENSAGIKTTISTTLEGKIEITENDYLKENNALYPAFNKPIIKIK